MYILYVYWVCADNHTFQEARICVEYEFFIIYIKLQDISRTTLIINSCTIIQARFLSKILIVPKYIKKKTDSIRYLYLTIKYI